jgi:hypothetical protein
MAGQRVGYIRISSFDQNPERQLESIALDRVFTDKASGRDARRPQLELLMGFVRSGDSVVVHSMDRLARNLDDLRRIVQTLTRRNVRIEFLKEHLRGPTIFGTKTYAKPESHFRPQRKRIELPRAHQSDYPREVVITRFRRGGLWLLSPHRPAATRQANYIN